MCPDPDPLPAVNMAVSGEVDLGFVETVQQWRLSSTFFPSKVGGKPAWLTLKPVPGVDNLKCGKCKEPCAFLLQVYAPISNEDTCFHRTVFVFICKNPACCTRNSNSNFVVLRSQLPKLNEFYSANPPDENRGPQNLTGAERYQDLCVVCGCAGSKRCGKCRKTSYCSREHQRYDWKQRHKAGCGELTSSGTPINEIPPSTHTSHHPQLSQLAWIRCTSIHYTTLLPTRVSHALPSG